MDDFSLTFVEASTIPASLQWESGKLLQSDQAGDKI